MWSSCQGKRWEASPSLARNETRLYSQRKNLTSPPTPTPSSIILNPKAEEMVCQGLCFLEQRTEKELKLELYSSSLLGVGEVYGKLQIGNTENPHLKDDWLFNPFDAQTYFDLIYAGEEWWP